MLHPLQRKIVALRRRVRLADAARGACIVVAATLPAVLALSAIDYCLRIQDRGVRIVFSLAALGVLAWASYRFLVKILLARIEEAGLAGAVERTFPALRNRLLSAVQFLRLSDDDPTAGSPALRRAVIEAAEIDARGLDFTAAVDLRRRLRAVWWVAAACLPAAAAVIAAPEATRIAALRIVNPFGAAQWPDRFAGQAAPPAVPPSIGSISIRLIPPSYTGLPPENAERLIRALPGTRVEISAAADRPLTAASLRLEDGTSIPARIEGDGRRLILTDFTVRRSGSYWFELTGSDGLRGESERWEVQAVADAPPAAEVERPASDLFITPEASLPIRVAAKDDLALARIGLAYRLDESEAERQLALYYGPATAPTAGGESLTADYRWQFAPLKLRPGMTATFAATAEDYRGQSAESGRRRLIVVSAEELLARTVDRVKLIAAELGRALRMQRDCRERVEALRSGLAGGRRPTPADADRLQAAEQMQREVALLLAGGGEGIPLHVRAVLADLENNRVENPLLRGRMQSLLGELARLERERLPAIERELAAAEKSIRLELEGQGGAARAADALAAAVENQNAVAAVLEQWIDRLTRTDSSGGFLLRLGVLLIDQRKAAERTAAVGRRTLARPLTDLLPDEAAELAAAAETQFELAQRTDRLLQEIARSLDQPGRQDLPAAGAAAVVANEARRRAVAPAMLDAADRIKANQVGRAAVGQIRIGRDLREILDMAVGEGKTGESAEDIIGEIEDDRQPKTADSQPEDSRPGATPGEAADQQSPQSKAEIERTRARMIRLWGELPPRVREAVLQLPAEDFPPKYQRIIVEYFRRLAEERGAGSGERRENNENP